MFRWRQNPDGAVDISERAASPWDRFCPWYHHGQIPVPGFYGMQSQTVGGIMRALQLIGPVGRPGRLDLSYLVGGERARGVPEGHWLTGYQLLSQRVGLAEARRKIFVPAYLWVLRNRVGELIARLRVMGQRDDVEVYDGLDNADLEAPKPLSYGALVCAYLNDDVEGFCANRYVPIQ